MLLLLRQSITKSYQLLITYLDTHLQTRRLSPLSTDTFVGIFSGHCVDIIEGALKTQNRSIRG